MLIPKRYKRYYRMNKQLEELANSLFGEMRDMTPEESKAYRESISKISNVRIFMFHIMLLTENQQNIGRMQLCGYNLQMI